MKVLGTLVSITQLYTNIEHFHLVAPLITLSFWHLNCIAINGQWKIVAIDSLSLLICNNTLHSRAACGQILNPFPTTSPSIGPHSCAEKSRIAAHSRSMAMTCLHCYSALKMSPLVKTVQLQEIRQSFTLRAVLFLIINLCQGLTCLAFLARFNNNNDEYIPFTF